MKTLNSIEFYRFEKDMCYRTADGAHHILTEDVRAVVSELHATIEEAYTTAYKALAKEYSKFTWNIAKFQFKIVDRFLRCNFGSIDNINDIDKSGRFNFEHVECPFRGVCHLEGIVCNPTINTKLGARTREVMELVFRGYEVPEIAIRLGKSPETVRNQQFRGYHILGVKNRADFVDYAHRNKLFKTED